MINSHEYTQYIKLKIQNVLVNNKGIVTVCNNRRNRLGEEIILRAFIWINLHCFACLCPCVWFRQLHATTQHLISLIKASWKNISLNALSQVINQTSASRLYKSFKHFSAYSAALYQYNMRRVCIDSIICQLLTNSTVKDLAGSRRAREANIQSKIKKKLCPC